MKNSNLHLPCDSYRCIMAIILPLVVSLIFCVPSAKAQDSNILIGLASPAYGIKMKANFSGTGGWARGYSIVNQNDTQKFFGIGVLGSITDGISQMQYGYIGPDYNTSYMYFLPNGNVGIGTNNPSTKLAVNGTIRAKELKVETNGWPDYVFQPDYKLTSLDVLSTQIQQSGHLPDMPSALELQEEGIDVGNMLKLQQQKIEELTLYIIDQDKRIRQLEKSRNRRGHK